MSLMHVENCANFARLSIKSTAALDVTLPKAGERLCVFSFN